MGVEQNRRDVLRGLRERRIFQTVFGGANSRWKVKDIKSCLRLPEPAAPARGAVWPPLGSRADVWGGEKGEGICRAEIGRPRQRLP